MKKFFGKFKKEKRVVPKVPEWDEIVEMLYDKQLEFLDSKVEKVIYSNDKAKRYVILKNNKGFFTYRLEKIYQLDEEEWRYSSSYDLSPAFWQVVDNGHESIFYSLEVALKELEREPEYKGFDLT